MTLVGSTHEGAQEDTWRMLTDTQLEFILLVGGFH